MVAVSADDYAWFTEQYADLADAYCLTLVRGRTPAELLEQVGAVSPVRSVGVQRVTSFAVAAASLGDWTLLITAAPVNGRHLSRGTVLVSHSGDAFVWARDGELLLEFDPADATRRTGTDPDALVDVLDRLGFALSSDGEGGWGSGALQRERSLALAEQLTGASLTLTALESTTFTCGTLPLVSEGQPAAGAAGVVAAAAPARSTVPAARSGARPAAKAERWDEEYDAPDDDWSDAATDEDGETENDEREWPRLIAKVRRAFS
ncbi:hypothetical protein ACTI_30370 [Actinoplanes sp. OR16]|uniref:DUF6461 domain-containing protein n=1 Tax=Actinoplanes sp. OR16 TaxID=946334 RepID=UPI000F71C642|nr:DUF6461 domain-containing protein [Actinoplanes sp. OR16]BBH66352.1 hypothetical protein ACTI_30370 [Actinoplanes sp. OR16]